MTVLIDVARVRALNDILRRTLCGGTLMLTPGIVALGRERQTAILAAIATFESFDADDDPYAEHDFGVLTVTGERIYFKIDYYDQWLMFVSQNPADSQVTARVLTVILAH